MGAATTAYAEALAGHERARAELLADIAACERRISREHFTLAESRLALADCDAEIENLRAKLGAR